MLTQLLTRMAGIKHDVFVQRGEALMQVYSFDITDKW